jgi:hypothetical protein
VPLGDPSATHDPDTDRARRPIPVAHHGRYRTPL